MKSFRQMWAYGLALALLGLGGLYILVPGESFARNILEYRDTISTSAPGKMANHTFSFVVNTPLSPSSYFEFTFPDGFEIISTSTFSLDRNVEFIVDGLPRLSGTLGDAITDEVEIIYGSPGIIRYRLNPTDGIPSGSRVELKVGNQTTLKQDFLIEFSTTTGTTTTPADTPPIKNATTTGTHAIDLKIYDGVEVADAGFVISLIEQVGVGPVDTTENIPPLRFNGAPTSSVGGTTPNVEVSLETDELATCRYNVVADTDFNSMPFVFTNTGQIFHSVIIPVLPETTYTLFVRCIDDEDNFNPDDFVITFQVGRVPAGQSNNEGDVDGDGSGTGNDGTGSGSAGGNDTGSATGENSAGGSSGGGGGGGGGGRSGSESDNEAGGGFEDTDGPYESGDAQVQISGFAYPRSKVSILVDGKLAKTVTADASGKFIELLEKIARGAYTFAIYAEDEKKVRSSTFSTSFTVSGARTSALSNINLPPTMVVSPDPVNPGSPLTISGFSLPKAEITLEREKDGSVASRITATTTASDNGAWTIVVDTTGLTPGTYKARVKSKATSGASSNFSNYTVYGVGQAAKRASSADLNTDPKVNLTDFSILLFHWGKPVTNVNPSPDLNTDSKVNLTDFSILLFNWTG